MPGQFCGWRSLAGYSPWDHKELDMTELTHMATWWVKARLWRQPSGVIVLGLPLAIVPSDLE